jgi:diaminohydroxyphosphoribosylaminopyrimidine deaminase/5-amino-6-(5-phosphoribosylamino)uracil reductase
LVKEREPGRGGFDPAQDVRFMREALAVARRGLGLASPNPMVGAVVVAGDRVVGEGWHEGPGTPHAEVMALARAAETARNATLYVTLEPCSHQGRTPPCAPAIVDAGITRIVASMRDPNPVVDGRGFAILRQAGLEVEEGLLRDEAEGLMAGFAKHVRTGLPLVTLKMAASLDGKVAARDGSSRWITGEAGREDAHRARAESDAIVVGAGTALADDPALTVRLPGYRGRQPIRILVDGSGRVQAGGSLFDGAAPTLVATTSAGAEKARAGWEAAGAEVLTFDEQLGGGVPLARLMEVLGKRDIQSVLIEGGPTLAWSAIREDIVDRLVLYLAPKLIGGTGSPGVLGGLGIESISEAIALTIDRVTMVGDDVRVEAHVHRDR